MHVAYREDINGFAAIYTWMCIYRGKTFDGQK